MSTKKVERKPRKMSQLRHYFIQNLFTRKKKTKKILSFIETPRIFTNREYASDSERSEGEESNDDESDTEKGEDDEIEDLIISYTEVDVTA